MELLPGLVTAELPVAQRSERVQELIGGIRASGQLEVLPLVTALGPFLTSEDDAVRTRAVLLLAEVRAILDLHACAKGLQECYTLSAPRQGPLRHVPRSAAGCADHHGVAPAPAQRRRRAAPRCLLYRQAHRLVGAAAGPASRPERGRSGSASVSSFCGQEPP